MSRAEGTLGVGKNPGNTRILWVFTATQYPILGTLWVHHRVHLGGQVATTQRRGKGEGSLFKNSNGLWEARVALEPGLDGKRRQKVIRRKVKSEAQKELRKMQKELAETGDLITSSITLEKWSEHWLIERSKKLSPNTIAGYRVAFRDYINPLLGTKKINRITAHDVKHLHDVILETPKDKALRVLSDPPEGTEMLSTTYALLIHNALSACLKMAVNGGKVVSNVCDKVERPTKRYTDEKSFTLEEAIKLLGYLAPREDGVLWATYLLSGARRGEIIGLEVDRVTDVLDLSWQTQRITDISKAPNDRQYRHLRGNLYLARPKSKAGWRTPPLVEPLATILRRHIGDRTEGLVFLDRGNPWDPADASKEWKKILRDAGVPDDVKLHGARHTAVGLLYQAGISEAVIMQIIGHSTVSVTRSYGRQGNQEMLRAEMEKVSALLASGTRSAIGG